MFTAAVLDLPTTFLAVHHLPEAHDPSGCTLYADALMLLQRTLKDILTPFVIFYKSDALYGNQPLKNIALPRYIAMKVYLWIKTFVLHFLIHAPLRPTPRGVCIQPPVRGTLHSVKTAGRAGGSGGNLETVW